DRGYRARRAALTSSKTRIRRQSHRSLSAGLAARAVSLAKSRSRVLGRESFEHLGRFEIPAEDELTHHPRVEPGWFGLMKEHLERSGEPQRVIDVRKVTSSVE